MKKEMKAIQEKMPAKIFCLSRQGEHMGYENKKIRLLSEFWILMWKSHTKKTKYHI